MSESNTSEKSGSSDLGTDPTSDASDIAASKDTTATALTSSVGTLLCATRMRLGRDLQLVAQLLHIRYSYLVAIEDGRYEDLPGQAYAVGFVRAYADHLGLDGAEVVRRFKEENAGISQKIPFEFPIPTPDSGVPSGALLLLAVVFGMVIYASWYSIAGSERGAIQLIQEVPNRLMALLENGGQSPVTVVERSEDSEVIEAPIQADLASESNETSSAQSEGLVQPNSPNGTEGVPALDGGVSNSSTNASAEGTASDDIAPATSAQSQSSSEAIEEQNIPDSDSEESQPSENTDDETNAGEEELTSSPPVNEVRDGSVESNSGESVDGGEADSDSGSVVELRAISDSWIQLREDDDLVLTRLLREGETFRVPEQAGLTLMTGNAGGLQVLVNGEVMAPLGDEGTIVRGVPIDPLRSSPPAD